MMMRRNWRWYLDKAARVLIWGEEGGFAIFREIGDASGRVGCSGLRWRRPVAGVAPISWWRCCRFAFDDLGAQRSGWTPRAKNLRAQRVYERAGFVLEGRLRAHWYRRL